MPRVIALLLTAMSMGNAVAASAQERPFEELPVTIRIHDYAHVSNGSLSRATRLVSEVYQRIGVRTTWMDTVRFGEKKANAERSTPGNQIAQITILVVTQKMASRGQMGPDVLGFAAVSTEGMGRIAYVVYDRVRDTALAAGMSADDVLAFVLVHDIARLLSPTDLALPSAAMKSQWTIAEFAHVDIRKMTFSSLQASLMRTTIENDYPSFAARAARVGSGQPTN